MFRLMPVWNDCLSFPPLHPHPHHPPLYHSTIPSTISPFLSLFFHSIILLTIPPPFPPLHYSHIFSQLGHRFFTFGYLYLYTCSSENKSHSTTTFTPSFHLCLFTILPSSHHLHHPIIFTILSSSPFHHLHHSTIFTIPPSSPSYHHSTTPSDYPGLENPSQINDLRQKVLIPFRAYTTGWWDKAVVRMFRCMDGMM